MKHSTIVGGSTAKRVMACPASVSLCAQVPARPSNEYADKGTLCHDVIAQILGGEDTKPEDFLGTTYNEQVLDQETLDEKIKPALAALDAIDPDGEMEYEVETLVSFGKYIPDAFGSTDLMGRIGNRAIVLDWKFGDGVPVEATENPQLMYYAAAGMRTSKVKWVFDGATEVECIIVQPPHVRRWVTTPARIKQFERELKRAVKRAEAPDAEYNVGDHCRWCAGKPLCPKMTGATERALKTQVASLDAVKIGLYLGNADLLELWIKDLRALAFQMLESGAKVPGYKLVAKRGTRQWVDDERAKSALLGMGLSESDVMESSLMSPAKVEKVLKKRSLALPETEVVSISSGSTLAPQDDPRPEVLQIGQQLTAALHKLV